MKTKFTILFLMLSSSVWAADGASFSHAQPTASAPSPNTCIDVCDKSNQNGAMTCGPIWAPVQDAFVTEWKVVGNSTNCAFDTVDIIEWDTSTAPSSEHTIILGTLDDDGAADCGLGINIACKAARVSGGPFGYVYVTSNGATVGGASCTSFKIRMCQQHFPR